jgi:putative NADH-flavin reductase
MGEVYVRIAVIGATGMVGTALTEELLSRDHQVTGVVRNIANLPAHARLSGRAADLMDMDGMSRAIAGHDVVICAFSPGHGMGVEVYKGLVEAGWRLKRAFKSAGGSYLINVGGTSSLWAPGGNQMFEDPRWPEWYFYSASPEHLRYLHAVTGASLFEQLALSRERIMADASLDPYAPWPEPEARAFLDKIASSHNIGEGGRAQLELFKYDVSFDWSFVSPPWFLRPGPRTGSYRTTIDDLPLDGRIPAGISVCDLAVAIADEAEKKAFVHKHWSAARV